MTLQSFPKTKTKKLSAYEKMLRQAQERREKYLSLPNTLILKNKRTKPVKKVLRKKRVKLPSIKKLEKKLKDVMYPYIKKRDGNICISCNKKGLVGRDWQAGHYIKAELCNMVTRYDEWNINSQCSTCNLWKRGNTIAYRLAMLDKYGEKAVNTLDREYKSPLPINFNSRSWLLEMIAKYKDETKS